MVSRRDATALMAGLGLGATALPWAGPAQADGHTPVLPTDPAEQNAAKVRMLGRTDEGESYWEAASRIYAVTDDGVTPLLKMRGGQRAWWKRESDTVYRSYPSSISFFVDPETGAFIDSFVNPLTGRTVPLKTTEQRRQDGEVFTPTGSYFPITRERFPEMYDDKPLDLDWRIDNGSIRLFDIEKFAPLARQPIYEVHNYFSPANVALDPDATTAPCVRTGWFTGSFSRWLDMADVDGVMIWHFEGSKVFSLEDLGADYLAHARATTAYFDTSPEFDEGPSYIERVEQERTGSDD